MAVLAKGLPVFFVPEQSLVAPVWDDMIHHRCRGQLAFPLALRTQGMPFQKRFSRSAPTRVIPAGIRSAAHTVRAPHDVIPAEYLSRQTEAWASWIAAGSRRSPRHSYHLTSPASAYRGNRIRCRRSCFSWPDQEPSPAQPHHPLFRWISLCPA